MARVVAAPLIAAGMLGMSGVLGAEGAVVAATYAPSAVAVTSGRTPAPRAATRPPVAAHTFVWSRLAGRTVTSGLVLGSRRTSTMRPGTPATGVDLLGPGHRCVRGELWRTTPAAPRLTRVRAVSCASPSRIQVTVRPQRGETYLLLVTSATVRPRVPAATSARLVVGGRVLERGDVTVGPATFASTEPR